PSTAHLLPTPSQRAPARPAAALRILQRAVDAQEKKSSGRRCRRHTCKIADVASQGAPTSFRSANGTKTISRKIQRDCARLEIRPGIDRFPGAAAQRTDYKRSKAFG